jgi:hypothetical protein
VFGVTTGCHAITTGFRVESLADNDKQSIYQDNKTAYGKGGDQHKEEAESPGERLIAPCMGAADGLTYVSLPMILSQLFIYSDKQGVIRLQVTVVFAQDPQ